MCSHRQSKVEKEDHICTMFMIVENRGSWRWHMNAIVIIISPRSRLKCRRRRSIEKHHQHRRTNNNVVSDRMGETRSQISLSAQCSLVTTEEIEDIHD